MKKLTTIADLWQYSPKIINSLINNIDYTFPRMDSIAKLVKNKNYIRACNELLTYYSTTRNTTWKNWTDWDVYPIENYELEESETIFQDIFTFQKITYQIPRLSDGCFDWQNLGPNNDREFGFFINRLHYLIVLFLKWKKTQEPRYIEKLNDILQEWLLKNPCPKKYQSTVQWRTLEASLRLNWIFPYLFFGIDEYEAFTPATRILLLSTIPEHTNYCKKFVVKSGNIRVMILNAVTKAAAFWPEMKDSTKWLNFTIPRMTKEILHRQVYVEDGAQMELTNHYHHVTILNFESFYNLATKAIKYQQIIKKNQIIQNKSQKSSHNSSKKIKSLPSQEIHTILERMWNYYAYNMRPDGYGLLNNDSDRDFVRSRVLKAAKLWNHPDWTYIASNGEEGIEPKNKSIMFPWAGHMIFRNGWDQKAEWGFFDCGPYGLGHQHRDKLHLSIAAYGRDLLVDGGRFRYVRDNLRVNYFQSTLSHNTILIDKLGQKPYQKTTKTPISKNMYYSSENCDWVIGTYSHGYKKGYKVIKDKILHTRVVIYTKKGFWLVLDHVHANKPHNIHALWHFNPTCTVKKNNHFSDSVRTTDHQQGNIWIIPVQIASSSENPINKLKLTLKRGINADDEIQGWWSQEYNHIEPTTCAEYTKENQKNFTIGWILFVCNGIPNAEKFPIQDFSIDQSAPDQFQWNIKENGKIKSFSINLTQKDSTIPSINIL